MTVSLTERIEKESLTNMAVEELVDLKKRLYREAHLGNVIADTKTVAVVIGNKEPVGTGGYPGFVYRDPEILIRYIEDGVNVKWTDTGGVVLDTTEGIFAPGEWVTYLRALAVRAIAKRSDDQKKESVRLKKEIIEELTGVSR